MQPTIVGTGPIDERATALLQPFGEVIIAPDPSEETLIPMMGEAIGLMVRGDGRANRRMIEAAPNLKVIGRTGVGYDNIDIAAASERRIPVVYTPGVNARIVAEASITLVLTLCKRVAYWDRQLKSGNWSSRNNFATGDVEGATLGIVGFGNIGQVLAALAGPFKMTLLAHDPYVAPAKASALGVTLTSLPELLTRSDFVCLHAVLNDETRGLINRESLQSMKQGAFIINLARGELVESLDLLEEALDAGKLAGVALDVFSPEPPDVSHPIFKRENCLTSPHAFGMTRRGMTRSFIWMAEDMVEVFSGRRPQRMVNPEVLEQG